MRRIAAADNMKKPEPVPYLGDRLRSVLFLPPRGVFYP